jgi:outer membrane lipoprotein-sorting protein
MESAAPNEGDVMIRSAVLLCVGVLAIPGLPGVALAGTQTAREIVDRVHHTFDQIDDYRVTVSVHVDVEGFQVPDRAIGLLYKKPDKVELIGADFATLPREGLMASPSQILDEGRYEIRLAREEDLEGQRTFVLHLFDRDFMDEDAECPEPDLTVWVDRRRWVIVQMEACSGGKKQGRVTIDHARIDEAHWLPGRTEVEIYMENIPGARPPRPASDSTAVSRQPDRGIIELTFHEYEVNVGLPDSLFQEP